MTLKKTFATMLAAGAILQMHAALASTLLFQGQNAAIFPGANPSGQPLLLESVQRPVNPALSSANSALTPASLIEQSVESQISAQIYNQIFNTSNASGSFSLGNGSLINYVRAGGNVEITITDPVNGTTTITIPDL